MGEIFQRWEHEPRSWRPRTASMEHNKERVDELIRGDRHVNVDDIAAKLAVGHSAVQEMIQSLGYRKVCARWVPCLLTKDHKLQKRTIWVENSSAYSLQPQIGTLRLTSSQFC